MNKDGIRWIPGHQNGEDVRVVLNKPIKFKIEKESIYNIDSNQDTELSNAELLPPTFEKTETVPQKTSSLRTIISPNPANDYLQLTIQGSEVPTTIEIVDLLGRILFQKELETITKEYVEMIPLETKGKGMVIVMVTQGKEVSQQKVLMQ